MDKQTLWRTEFSWCDNFNGVNQLTCRHSGKYGDAFLNDEDFERFKSEQSDLPRIVRFRIRDDERERFLDFSLDDVINCRKSWRDGQYNNGYWVIAKGDFPEKQFAWPKPEPKVAKRKITKVTLVADKTAKREVYQGLVNITGNRFFSIASLGNGKFELYLEA